MKLESRCFIPKESEFCEEYVQHIKDECLGLLKDQIFELIKNGADIKFGHTVETSDYDNCLKGTIFGYYLFYEDNGWRQKLTEMEIKSGTRI